MASEDLETAVAEAARDALIERNADGKARRPAVKRNLGHLPDHPASRIDDLMPWAFQKQSS